MPDLFDLSPDAVTVPDPETYHAVILEDATAGLPVRFTIPSLSNELSADPAPWTPIVTVDGIFYPKKGDDAIVIRPQQGTPYIAGWTPKATVPDGLITGSGDAHVALPFAAVTVQTLSHNLGKRPAVNITDSAGTEVQGVKTEHLSDNATRFTVEHPFSGTATFN